MVRGLGVRRASISGRGSEALRGLRTNRSQCYCQTTLERLKSAAPTADQDEIPGQTPQRCVGSGNVAVYPHLSTTHPTAHASYTPLSSTKQFVAYTLVNTTHPAVGNRR